MELADNYDWQIDPAYIKLLELFKNPQEPEDLSIYFVSGMELKESLDKAINRLMKDGAVDECNLAKKADSFLYAADLKDMLRDNGYKTSGTKTDLIRRIIELDVGILRERIGERRLLMYTSLGIEIIKKFNDNLLEKQKEVEESVFNFLVERDIKSAYRIYREYTAQYEGKNVSDQEYRLERLEESLGDVPQVLFDRYGSITIRQFQAASGMTNLWRKKNIWSYLPNDFPLSHEEIESIKILIDHYRIFNMRIKSSGYNGYVQIEFDQNNPFICDNCNNMNGKVFSVPEISQWPFINCENDEGCLPKISSAREPRKKSQPDELEERPEIDVQSKKDSRQSILYIDGNKFKQFVESYQKLIEGILGVGSYGPKEERSSTAETMEDEILEELIKHIDEENFFVRLRQIRLMVEEGLITEEEYESKKKELLERF